jgi:predicted alpha/beta superfamily hydrolase
MKRLLTFLVIITCFNATINAQNAETISDSIFSKTLNEHRQFWVQLPENYNLDSKINYPVLYVLDGFSLKSTLETVYNNYWGHYLPHMILVGISNRENRTRDLTISKIETRRGGAIDDETGGADNFTKFIEEELLPYIDIKYKTTPYRTLIGHSYAGLFTINTLLNHQHLFANYIAIDPSIEWDNQKQLKEAKIKLATESYKGKSLFVSLAAEQLNMQDESVTIENLMEDASEFSLFARSIVDFSLVAESQKQNELNFDWKIYPEDLHGTVPLPSMQDGLVFLFNWYQFKHPQKYNNPDTSVKEIEELLKAQAEIYLEHFGYSVPPMVEELFNGYGYMNLQMGNPEKSLLFFKKGIQYYPSSASVYDSIADYYEAQDDIPNALKYVTKAFEISGNEYHKERITTLKSKLKK